MCLCDKQIVLCIILNEIIRNIIVLNFKKTSHFFYLSLKLIKGYGTMNTIKENIVREEVIHFEI